MEAEQSSLVTLTQIVVALLASLDILLNKHRPASAVLWLGVVWSFPWLGPLGYVVFGIDRVRWLGKARADAGMISPAIRALLPPPTPGSIDRASEDTAGAYIFRVTEPAVRPFAVTWGNTAELLVDGDAFYPALLEAIRSAGDSIHLQSYIITRDAVGREILEALKTSAAAGLTIRLLYDRFGSALAHFSGFFRSARRAGIEVRPNRTWGHINLRNHRKVAIIDGNVAFVGGLNIDARNVRGRTGEDPDRDYHVRLRGPAVTDLQLQFLSDWGSATRTPLDRFITEAAFPPPAGAGAGLVQVVPGGAEAAGTGLAKAYFGAIASARESVTVVTPYFLPPDAIFEALRFAALRGVRVKIVLPARSNHWYTAYAARALYAPLLRAGVRILERGPPFMHAKALVVDGAYAMLGSANLDYRSLHLNFELDVEVVDAAFVAGVEAQVATEIDASREVLLEAHENRSLLARLTESVCRLFQPVL